jgi:hypothetical protein
MTAEHSLRLPAFGHEHGFSPRTCQRCDAMHTLLFDTLPLLLLYSHDSYIDLSQLVGQQGNTTNKIQNQDGDEIIGWKERAQASRNGPLPRSGGDHHRQLHRTTAAQSGFLFLMLSSSLFHAHHTLVLSLVRELSNDRISSL